MSYAEWPAGVPGPERDALRRAPVSTLVRRRTQDGRTEVRRFGSGAPDRIEASLLLTVDEYADLVSFYETDCDMGASWFTAGWIVTIGYTSSHVGRIIGLPRTDFHVGARRIAVTFLIQHQDNL